MKQISILVLKGAILGSLEGTRQLFTQVNHFFKDRDLPAPFDVQLVGLTSATALTGGLFTAHNHVVYHEVKKSDLIVIPAFDGNIDQAIEDNQDFLPWIVEQYKKRGRSSKPVHGCVFTGINRIAKRKKMRYALDGCQ